jgi:heavy metal translocating P-type ATPase
MARIEQSLEVHGMWCASCARAVERTLQRAPGVIASSVSLVGETAQVAWNPRLTSLERLRREVSAAGYRIEPADDIDAGASSAAASLERELRVLQTRLIVAVMLGMWVMLPQWVLYASPSAFDDRAAVMLGWIGFVLTLPIVFYSGQRFLTAGWRTARVGVPGVDTLVASGAVGALGLSLAQLLQGQAHALYLDSAAMLVTLLLAGRLLELRMRAHAGNAIRELATQAPATARVVDASGSERIVGVRALAPGMVVRVLAGEVSAVDGTVVEGRSDVDRRWLNGESAPRAVACGDLVEAGSRNGAGSLLVRVLVPAGERRIDEIGRRLRMMLATKSHLQALVDRWSSALIVLIAVAAGLAGGLALLQGESGLTAAARALAVLVATCPCAIGLALPLVLRRGSVEALRLGAMVRDPAVVESAHRIDTVVLDKTGTLTAPSLSLAATEVFEPGLAARDALCLAAQIAHASSHPLAAALRDGAQALGLLAGGFDGLTHERAGEGIEGRAADGAVWRLGRPAFAVAPNAVPTPAPEGERTTTALACDGRLLAQFNFDEQLLPEARGVIDGLHARGLEVWVASGDHGGPVARAAAQLGIPARRALAACSPERKAGLVRELRDAGRHVLFAGDGINDAPAIAAASLGIAMHGAGAASQSAATMVMLRDGLADLPELLDLTRALARRSRATLAWAVAYNLLALPAALLGWVTPMLAAALMAMSSLSVTANALRPFSFRGRTPPSTGVTP